MADTSETIALLALGQELRGNIVANINRRSALLRLLPIVAGAGQNCAWAVEGDGQVGEAYAEGADVSNYGSDAQAQASLGWGRYRANVHITGSARRAAESAMAGPTGARDLVGRNMRNSAAKIASDVNTDLFGGDGTGGKVYGFGVAIGDDANTYAGIDRTVGSNAYWKPTVVDPGAPTSPTLALIRSDRTAIYKKCGENPDLAFCSPEVFDTIGGLYDATRRYVQPVDKLTTARGQVTLDAGFAGLELDGMVFIKDKDATANTIFYVNSNYVEIQYQPLDPKLVAMLMELGVSMQADDGFGPLPLGIRTKKLADTGDSDKYMTFTELQLVVRRPNACGVRKNVATT